MLRIVCVGLVLLILALQYKAWFSDSGFFALDDLRAQVSDVETHVEALSRDNRVLRAEVVALKEGTAAIEARAREDLGMVREDEVFFLVPSTEPSRP